MLQFMIQLTGIENYIACGSRGTSCCDDGLRY